MERSHNLAFRKGRSFAMPLDYVLSVQDSDDGFTEMAAHWSRKTVVTLTPRENTYTPEASTSKRTENQLSYSDDAGEFAYLLHRKQRRGHRRSSSDSSGSEHLELRRFKPVQFQQTIYLDQDDDVDESLERALQFSRRGEDDTNAAIPNGLLRALDVIRKA